MKKSGKHAQGLVMTALGEVEIKAAPKTMPEDVSTTPDLLTFRPILGFLEFVFSQNSPIPPPSMAPSLPPRPDIALTGIERSEMESNHLQMPEVQEEEAQPMPVDIEQNEMTPAPMQVSHSMPVHPKESAEHHLSQTQSPQLD